MGKLTILAPPAISPHEVTAHLSAVIWIAIVHRLLTTQHNNRMSASHYVAGISECGDRDCPYALAAGYTAREHHVTFA